MFRDIKVGDYVVVAKSISSPYEREIVCEVNDKTFKCGFDDSTAYSKENGRSRGFAFAIPYDEDMWNGYCFQVSNGTRKSKALEVIKNFYDHSCCYSVEDCELVAEMIKRIKKN